MSSEMNVYPLNLTSIILDDVLDYIVSKETSHATIYVAIGSAAHMAKEDCFGNWYIEPQFEQQFPPFLSSLKKLCPFEPIHIILIDPMLEDPPFVVCDKKKNLANGWNKINNETICEFYNDATNVHVYPIKSYISYLNNCEHEQCTDAMPFFKKLNMIACVNDWLVIVHDYSGYDAGTLGKFFDDALMEHRDHIIYGIDVRSSERGCYIDLTKPGCDFVYNIMGSSIKIFNPFNFTDHVELMKQLDIYKSISSDGDDAKRNYVIAHEQVKCFVLTKRKFIISDVMTALRQIKRVMDGSLIDLDMFKYSLKNVSSRYLFDIDTIIKTRKYNELFLETLNILKHELINQIYSVYGEQSIDIVDVTIYNMLEQSDYYKWTAIIRKLLDDYDKRAGFI